VDVEPNPGERVTRLTIIDTVSRDNEVGFYLHPGRGLVGHDYVVLRNLAQDNRKYGLILNSVQTGLVYDNHVTGSPKGISVGSATEESRARDVIVANNLVEMCPQGLIFAGVERTEVVGNSAGRPFMPALGIAGDMGFKRNQ
jgi:nitrous oxidase accessory protein NosD